MGGGPVWGLRQAWGSRRPIKGLRQVLQAPGPSPALSLAWPRARRADSSRKEQTERGREGGTAQAGLQRRSSQEEGEERWSRSRGSLALKRDPSLIPFRGILKRNPSDSLGGIVGCLRARSSQVTQAELTALAREEPGAEPPGDSNLCGGCWKPLAREFSLCM